MSVEPVFRDYLDFYRRGPFAPYVKEHRVAGSAPVRLFATGQPAGSYPTVATPDLKVEICVRGASQAGIDVGAGRMRFLSRPGNIVLAPSDAPGDYVLDGPHELLFVAIPIDGLMSAIGDARPGFAGDFGLLHAAPFRDDFIESLCRRLWLEAAEGGALGSLFCDGAVVALATALLRLAEQREIASASKGGLGPLRLRRILELLEEQLASDIRLSDLAAAADLHPGYFSRAFKAETGTTPHRYLLERRVERAKILLATTRLPIAEIALACGFASQSHLSTWFRRLTGTSPKRWRESQTS